MKFKLSILVFLIVTIFSISCDSKEIDSKSKDLDNDISDEIVNNNLDRLDIEEDLTLINYTDESNSFSLNFPDTWKVVTSMAQLFEVFKDALSMESSIAPVLFAIDEASGDNIFVTLEFTELYEDKPQLIDVNEYANKEVEKLREALFESESSANQNIIQNEVKFEDGTYGYRIEIYHTEVPLLQILYILINPSENGWCGSLPFMFTGSLSSEEGNEINLNKINKILNSFKVEKAPPNIDCDKRETLSILNNIYDE